MRGKVDFSGLSRHNIRITPAYAGKRASPQNVAYYLRDHPRVCGEKGFVFADAAAGGGSPPRMRGKVKLDKHRKEVYRITPAYAGKSLGLDWLPGLWQDHPRVCGEKLDAVQGRAAALGSPPRMRGKVPFLFAVTVALGITPAYAGKSPRDDRPPPLHTDHPRVCGEKLSIPGFCFVLSGSPPRMRGKETAGSW